jgi:hypothetical protein
MRCTGVWAEEDDSPPCGERLGIPSSPALRPRCAAAPVRSRTSPDPLNLRENPTSPVIWTNFGWLCGHFLGGVSIFAFCDPAYDGAPNHRAQERSEDPAIRARGGPLQMLQLASPSGAVLVPRPLETNQERALLAWGRSCSRARSASKTIRRHDLLGTGQRGSGPGWCATWEGYPVIGGRRAVP